MEKQKSKIMKKIKKKYLALTLTHKKHISK